MSFETLFISIEEEIGIITLNRPEVRNALNRQVFQELSDAAITLSQDPSVRVIIITGGEKVFAAGSDIKEMVQLNSTEVAIEGRPSVPTYHLLENLPKPVIAAIAGYALGGGCELALATDVRIAGDNAQIGLPEIKLGIIPGGGGTQRLSRLIGVGRAKELIFSGEFINADEALRIGLVNKVVPASQLMEEAKRYAKHIAQYSPTALRMAKLAIDEGCQMELHAGIQYEHKCFSILFGTKDQKEGMTAFLEKRKPNFTGQ